LKNTHRESLQEIACSGSDTVTAGVSDPFRALFGRPSEVNRAFVGHVQFRERLYSRLAMIRELQGDYQPVYGLGREYEQSPRRANLLFNSAQVTDHFGHVQSKHQVRILDIGCNIGYTTLKIAESFPNIVGIDLDYRNVDFA